MSRALNVACVNLQCHMLFIFILASLSASACNPKTSKYCFSMNY